MIGSLVFNTATIGEFCMSRINDSLSAIQTVGSTSGAIEVPRKRMKGQGLRWAELDLPHEMRAGAAVERQGELGRAGDEPALPPRL